MHLEVSIDDQKLRVFQGDARVREFVVSTSAKGMGFREHSNRTPTGRFRIVEKIGDGAPVGTIFKSRRPDGVWTPGERPDDDLILTRILRIEGLDEPNANTMRRFIYFHGTNREDLLGQPASHGCIRLANGDMTLLFDMVSPGDSVEIVPATQKRGKLLFISCDRTLSAIHGMDELARMRGGGVFTKVSALSEAAMNGRIPIGEALRRSMDLVHPDKVISSTVADVYLKAATHGAHEFIRRACDGGWTPVMLTGAFMPLVHPLARSLGIEYIEAVPLFFNPDGSYAGYGSDSPLAGNHGKARVVREWTHAMLPEKTVMIGNSVPDLETKSEVDSFISFNGVMNRTVINRAADHGMQALTDRWMFGDGAPLA